MRNSTDRRRASVGGAGRDVETLASHDRAPGVSANRHGQWTVGDRHGGGGGGPEIVGVRDGEDRLVRPGGGIGVALLGTICAAAVAEIEMVVHDGRASDRGSGGRERDRQGKSARCGTRAQARARRQVGADAELHGRRSRLMRADVGLREAIVEIRNRRRGVVSRARGSERVVAGIAQDRARVAGIGAVEAFRALRTVPGSGSQLAVVEIVVGSTVPAVRSAVRKLR